MGGAATAASPRPPATYANVTLGVTGPTGFADGTAAGFTGSGSQISVPGGYFAGARGGGESAELWFSATKAGTLLSTGTGSGGDPPTLWVNSSGCVQGSISGIKLAAPSCQSVIGDGKWHQVVLTLSPVQTSTSGTATQTATLYVDGVDYSGAQPFTPATASPAGYTADIGNGPDGDFTGSIADVSLYTTQLSATDVTAHYDGLHNQVVVKEPGGNPANPTYLTTPALNTQKITVTDPFGQDASYVYAEGNLIRATDVLGGVTYYGYDAADRASTVTNPDGYTTYTTHDAYNNVTSTTTCAAINDCQTSYASYYENLPNPLDPRNNKPTDERDARSSSPYDMTYDTVTSYTPSAQIASRTTPPTKACPSGCETNYTYTTGSETAVGSTGTEPAGLLASTTAPGGGATSYAYNAAGDVTQVTDPLGMVTTYTYDNLGRQLSQTQISDTYPKPGLTTSYTYDDEDRVVTETDPPVTDRVTGAVHTKVTTHTYDPDDGVLTTTISDSSGGDPARTTTNTYDSHGDLASVTDAARAQDHLYLRLSRRPVQPDQPCRGQDRLHLRRGGKPAHHHARGLHRQSVESRFRRRTWSRLPLLRPGGERLASDTNVKGTTTDYTYYGDGRLASATSPARRATESVYTYTYDAAGNKVSETAPGGLVIEHGLQRRQPSGIPDRRSGGCRPHDRRDLRRRRERPDGNPDRRRCHADPDHDLQRDGPGAVAHH